jgi:pre-mRNA-splicing factor ATP-dependent RNA helicase DHX16
MSHRNDEGSYNNNNKNKKKKRPAQSMFLNMNTKDGKKANDDEVVMSSSSSDEEENESERVTVRDEKVPIDDKERLRDIEERDEFAERLKAKDDEHTKRKMDVQSSKMIEEAAKRLKLEKEDRKKVKLKHSIYKIEFTQCAEKDFL